MEIGAVEEIMRNLASAREELKQRQAQYNETQQSLNEATKGGAALIAEAKAKAQILQQPWQELSNKHLTLIASTERHIETLEEMLFVAMQIIQNRIEKD
jgi:uncharacterized protein (DUF3084 family)